MKRKIRTINIDYIVNLNSYLERVLGALNVLDINYYKQADRRKHQKLADDVFKSVSEMDTKIDNYNKIKNPLKKYRLALQLEKASDLQSEFISNNEYLIDDYTNTIL